MAVSIGTGLTLPPGTGATLPPNPETLLVAYGNFIKDSEYPPVPVPPLPYPFSQIGTLPVPTTVRDRVAAVFGYAPNSLVAAATQAGQNLQTAVNEAQGNVTALQKLVAAAQATASALSSSITTTQASISDYQNTKIPGVQAQINTALTNFGTNPTVAQMRLILQTLQTDWQGYEAQIGTTEAEIQSFIASLQGPQARPTMALQSDAATADGYGGSQDSYDSQFGFSGFAPATFSFWSGYQGVLSGSGPTSGTYFYAPPARFQASAIQIGSWSPGKIAATALGYSPTSLVANAVSEISSLLEQLGSANSTIGSLNQQLATLNLQIGTPTSGLTGALAIYQAKLQSLQSDYNALVADLQTIQASSLAEIASVEASLSDAIDKWQGYVSAAESEVAALVADLTLIQTPGFGHVSNWSFGDGNTSTDDTGIHVYQYSGGFQPQLAVTAWLPDLSKTWTRVFGALDGLLRRIIGQWPAHGSAGVVIGPVNNGLFRVTIMDRQGNPIANTRFSVTGQLSSGTIAPPAVYTTNSEGYVGVQTQSIFLPTQLQLGASFTVRSLRNPLAVNTATVPASA